MSQTMTADQVVELLIQADPMCDLPRTGWLLCGVASPESLAAHSWAVALVADCLADQLRADGEVVDREKVLRMALLHDLAEARTGDMPMPNKTETVGDAIHQLEGAIISQMLPPSSVTLWKEAEAGKSLEARVVKAADKIQMMIKVLVYESRRGADLDEFWNNPKNFRDMGLERAKQLYEAIRKRRKRSC